MHSITKSLLVAGRAVPIRALRPGSYRASFSTSKRQDARNQIFDP